MALDLTPERALIFRIVHIDNVGPILAEGCKSRNAIAAGAGYVEIGNQELIAKRTTREVPIAPGGTLSDYVPFYFTPCSPMLYNIKTGYTVPKKPMNEIAILVSSLRNLQRAGVSFVFTDRHAYLRTAQFSSDLADLNWIIWDALQARDFKRDMTDKFEKYQAEALAHQHVPTQALLGIVCKDEPAKAKIEAEAKKRGNDVKIIVKPQWYF